MEGPTWQSPEKPRSVKLTLSLPPSLRDRMARAEEILKDSGLRLNWSAICQKAIADQLDALGQ